MDVGGHNRIEILHLDPVADGSIVRAHVHACPADSVGIGCRYLVLTAQSDDPPGTVSTIPIVVAVPVVVAIAPT
jgi:hypothetical protein